ncbi:CpaE family protein [Castellaniella sp.]|uniref:AAA family ATPase n=1 Tax=Castellaniella sp. TaxID=1955812 RepID=UPI00355E42F0
MATAAKVRDTDRLYAFVAFLEDRHSQEEMQRVMDADTVSDTLVAPGGVDAAIAWLQKQNKSPQRLLVDISTSERALDDLDRLADACDPSVLVYVVGERNDVGLYRNLLARGVQDYLVKPLGVELIRRLLIQEKSNVRRSRHGRCVAIMGTRGGVGVSSVAAHLARALGQGGVRRRVVYVDLNPFDGCGAGILGCPGGTALLDILGNIDRLDHQYLERTLAQAGPNLFVLAAELDYSDEFLPSADALRRLLEALTQYFHYVVVDVPSRRGALVNEVLLRASLVGLLADPSVHSARTLARLARHIEARPNPPTVLPVLNHPWAPGRSQVQDADFKDVSTHPIRVSIAHDAKGPALAENLGQELPSGSEFARGVQALAALVTGEALKASGSSWWRRLFRGRA